MWDRMKDLMNDGACPFDFDLFTFEEVERALFSRQFGPGCKKISKSKLSKMLRE